jgi:subtilisin family serine protease
MMRKGVILVFCIVAILSVLFLNLSFAEKSFAKTSEEEKLFSKLNSQDKVRVIINVKPSEFQKASSSDEREKIIAELGKEKVIQKFQYSNGIAAEINKDDLEKLIASGNVDVREERTFKVALNESAVVVNATRTWPLQYLGLNLTGVGQTVCVVDTGINYSHSDLGGCYGNNNASSSCKVLGGYDYVNGDNNPLDDNGHGTHVSGIVASSGDLYRGIAPDAKLIAMKVLNSAGSGSETAINNGILWCVNNATAFNISVMVISIGGTINYTDYCDWDYPATFSPSIDAAVAKNISVVIATGNNGNVTAISAPSCMRNATRVANVAKTDVFASTSNRNNLTKLIAPGQSITSTYFSGGYATMSGTSQAAPHVAGAIAVINQILKMTSRSNTTQQIENLLNNTGKTIVDTGSSNLAYSRINLYAAVLTLDNIVPNVALSSPTNGYGGVSKNYTFSCSVSDWQLSNLTFYLWNSTNDIINQSFVNISGTLNSTSVNVTNLSVGSYKWNCKSYDLKNNNAFYSSNSSLGVLSVSANLTAPTNNTSTKNTLTNFTCGGDSESLYALSNVTFYLWNSSSGLVYNTSANISGVSNSSVFAYNITSDGNYAWNCKAYNNVSTSSWNANGGNFSLYLDSVAPTISIVSSASITTTSAVVSWATSENSNSSVNYGTTTGLGFYSSPLNDNVTVHSVSVSALASNTTYYYNVTSCDALGNCATSGPSSFTTSGTTTTTNNDGGGGGGGGDGVSMYTLNAEQSLAGLTKFLGVADKIKFVIATGVNKTESHIITLKNLSIVDKKATFSIQSSLSYVTLGEGEGRKINITSADYYDLYVKVNSIDNTTGANIMMQVIKEAIPSNAFKATNASSSATGNNTATGFITQSPASTAKQLNQKLIQNVALYTILLSVVVAFITAVIYFWIKFRQRAHPLQMAAQYNQYPQ